LSATQSDFTEGTRQVSRVESPNTLNALADLMNVGRILSGVVPTSEKNVEENFKRIAEAQVHVDACAKLIDARCTCCMQGSLIEDSFANYVIVDQRQQFESLGDAIDGNYNHACFLSFVPFLTKIGTNSKLDTVIAGLQSIEILSKNQKQLKIVLQQLEGPIIRSASMLQDYKDSMQGNVSFQIIHRSTVYIPNYLPFRDVLLLGKANKFRT